MCAEHVQMNFVHYSLKIQYKKYLCNICMC